MWYGRINNAMVISNTQCNFMKKTLNVCFASNTYVGVVE